MASFSLLAKNNCLFSKHWTEKLKKQKLELGIVGIFVDIFKTMYVIVKYMLYNKVALPPQPNDTLD